MHQTNPKSSATPLVAVVILNWNGYEDTVECIQSLQNIQYSNFEIIIVDNSSTDGSQNKLLKKFPDINLIQCLSNGGYATGNNAGIRIALERGAAYILIVNNDVVAKNDFITPMVECAEQDLNVGIVTCKAFHYSDSTRVYCTGGTISMSRCSGINLSPSLQDMECDVTYISGCVLLVKRKVFETVGFLDEKYFMYFEDFEFSRRAGKYFRLIYYPKGIVYHKSGAGKKWDEYTPTYLYYHTRNRFWVFLSESVLYRSYVVMFSIINVIAKSFVILIKNMKTSSRSFPVKELKALWCGLKDGMIKQPDSNSSSVGIFKG
jgi:GT2 family glycosyltransferase